MGSRQSAFPQVNFQQATARIGAEGMDRLTTFFENIAPGPNGVIPREGFARMAALEIGLGPASRLVTLLDGEDGLTFPKFVVGVSIFQSASVRGGLVDLVFALFDTKQCGFLGREDLCGALEAIIHTSDSPFPNDPHFPDGGILGSTPSIGYLGTSHESQQPLVQMMAEAVLHRFDADSDKRISVSEWARFAETEPGVVIFAERLAGFMTRALGGSAPFPVE